MTETYICDECDSRISSLNTIIEVSGQAEFPIYHAYLREPKHFCSFTCLRNWTESMVSEYEVDNG